MFQNHEKKFPPKKVRFVKKYIKVHKTSMFKEFTLQSDITILFNFIYEIL